MNNSIYQTLYDSISTYIFGGNIPTASYQELVTISIATIGCLFVFAIPFILVLRVIRFIGG